MLTAWGAVASAQSLAECIATAREHNIGMQVADLQVQRARRMEGSYFEMERTELSLSQDPTSGGSPDNALTLSQRFDFPTVYGSRRKMLKAETEVEASRRRLTESELTRDVSSAYSTLLYWQHIEALLCQNDSVLTAFVTTADVRFRNGETNRLELMNAQQMKAENTMQLQEAQNERAAAVLRLQQLMNVFTPPRAEAMQASTMPRQGKGRMKSNTQEPVVATDDYQCIRATDGEYSFAATPQGRLSESEQTLSERRLAYAGQGFMPSLNVGLRHQLVIPGINPYNVDRSRFAEGNWMGFEVGIGIPLFYGSQKAKRAAARLDVDIARASREQAERQSGTELLQAENTVAAARRCYDYYQTDGLTAAREMRRLSCVEYEAGEISYVEHVQNLSSALAIEMAGAKATDALNQAVIKLNFIKGSLTPSPSPKERGVISKQGLK